jgi:hypothetical protein
MKNVWYRDQEPVPFSRHNYRDGGQVKKLTPTRRRGGDL